MIHFSVAESFAKRAEFWMRVTAAVRIMESDVEEKVLVPAVVQKVLDKVLDPRDVSSHLQDGFRLLSVSHVKRIHGFGPYVLLADDSSPDPGLPHHLGHALHPVQAAEVMHVVVQPVHPVLVTRLTA